VAMNDRNEVKRAQYWRPAAALILAALGASALGQVRLYVTIQGKRAGQAVASHKLLPNGNKLVQLSMQLAGAGGNTVTLRSESTYGPKGAPIRMFHESTTTNPRTRRSVTVTFTKAGATVVEEAGGKRTTKEVPLVAGAPVESKSEFWFIRDKPSAGATDKRYRFDVSSLSWELTTTTYVGPKTVVIGGKSFPGHEVHSTKPNNAAETAKAFVDANGLPIRMLLRQITLERVPGP
jgi:hypothetical protein